MSLCRGQKTDYSSISDEEWRKQLTDEQFYITRKKGTELAFTGEYWNTKTPGTYHCICCDTPLFESSTKFDSGTGWPSYYQPVDNNVKSKLDLSIIFMPRQEVVCAACNAHLGHVFDDGPPPTGKRYCINRKKHNLHLEVWELFKNQFWGRGNDGKANSRQLLEQPELWRLGRIVRSQ
ncbi:hypothetical protein K7X08_005507 [Anisodus acutangulus]|uniref:Peptide-methionine (R)-S-oxide reductase n=1 Tax=Anisodus acutangulus TaxID=402998 RepID=A0A9Q1LV07_9SOLA|nr:hypothetical protein K7X08_005507 [Anisodus acutangulus]